MDSPMIGGAKFQTAVLEWTKQSRHLLSTVAFSVIFIWAIFTEKLPELWSWQLSTSIGRLLLLLLLYIVHSLSGWIPTLLFTIAIALTWANRPLYRPVAEGWQDNVKTSDAAAHRWFVEKTLHENPKRIVQDRVSTFPVQD